MKLGTRMLAGCFAVVVIAALAVVGVVLGRPARTPAPSSEEAGVNLALLAATQAHAHPHTRVEERDGVAVVRRETGTQRPSRRTNPLEEGPQPRHEGLRLVGEMPPRASASFMQPTEPPTAPGDSPHLANAPFGRVLKCELVFTLESISEQTPIVALVTEDQWWNGRLVLPAGTEVHGRSRVDRSRDRMLSDENWVLVLPRAPGADHGRELHVRGHALDRDQPEGDGLTWGITDGSSGLRGTVLRTTDPAEVRLLAATFLSAATRSLGETTTTALGAAVPVPGARNAAVAGTSAALDELAARMVDEVRASGSYLRVPAGKQFYLYLTQSLDVPAARPPRP
jgi:hypothetical protein